MLENNSNKISVSAKILIQSKFKCKNKLNPNRRRKK